MNIIGITGRARSGKDTLASFLVDHHGYVRVGLADPLRNFVGEITGLSQDELMDGSTKEAPLPWLGGISPRRMMQTLGTEWGRDLVDDQLWLKVAERAIDKARRTGAPGVVIPDIRFDNEAQMVKALGGAVVRLERPDTGAVEAHSSEAGVHPELVSEVIQNDRSMSHLARWAEALAAE